MSVFDDLKFAIENRRVVTFTYDGHHRVVEPFLLGVTTAGKPALRGFQTAGTSKSGKVPDWHLFSLSKIVSIEVTPTCFEGARPFYNPADKAMLRIDALV
ncbi:MAG TPA: WYL domain-containing protein [Candidatus Duodenibacillus intestinavium]|nr:WYL domain-containing protein [Candidatus Duodenibacillus intestinavium]